MANPVNKVMEDLNNVQPAPGEPIPDDVVAAANPFADNPMMAMIYKQMQQESAARRGALQSQMDIINKQAEQYGQKGMSDLDKASLLFQAAGALAAPTRSGALMESVGAAGSAVAGPLQKAAQAERDRQEKVMQLQMARAKIAADMAGTGGVSAADMLNLYKAQEAAREKPAVQERLLERLRTEKDPQVKAALRAQLGLEPEEAPEVARQVPAEVKALGPAAVKKYIEGMGTKVATEMSAAQSAAENLTVAMPILERAEKAYQALGKSGGIGPIISSGPSRKIGAVVGTENEINRQNYEQAAKELELLQAQIKMKGQGQITEGERKILAMTLPRLDAADPKVGYATLQQFRQQLNAALKKPERIRQRGGEEEGEPKTSGKVVDFKDLK